MAGFAEVAYELQADLDFPRDLIRAVDDDLVEALGFNPKRLANELVDAPEVLLGALRPREYEGERQAGVVRVEQNSEQIENFFGRSGTAGEDNNPVSSTDKGFQPLFDVGEDDQLVDDGVGRFGGDDSRFGKAEIATGDALFCVANGGALHRAFHGARAAAGADVQVAQA